MSDPVTNVEIEDVLSSIRRLVSDGDKARTRDPAPVEVTSQDVASAVEAASESTQSESQSRAPQSAPHSDRLVLTPAFLVVDGQNNHHEDHNAHQGEDEDHNAQTDADEGHVSDHHDDEDEDEWVEEIAADEAHDAEHENGDADEEPLPLTEMVWEDVEDGPENQRNDHADIASEPLDADVPDRTGLVATIAELEAAISAGNDEFEPDGSEEMGETIAWPGAPRRGADMVEDADISDVSEVEIEAEIETEIDGADTETATFEHRQDDDVEPADTPDEMSDPDANPDAEAEEADVYGDDDLDGLLEAGGTTLDEEALRALVAEVVREELTGPMGERITRNVRKLVRREIYRILSSQEFD